MDSQADLADQLDDEVRAYRALERRILGTLAQRGVSVDSWRVLRQIARLNGASMKDVLDATGLPPASATRAVDSLVALGHVFRRPAEFDRRSVQVLITESGATALAEIERDLAKEFVESRG